MRLPALLALAAIASCASPAVISKRYDFSRIRRVGVLRFEAPKGGGAGVDDLFAKHLLDQGYSVVERSKLEAVLHEQKLGAAGAFSQRTVKQVGRILGVDALVLGRVTTFVPETRAMVMVRDYFSHAEPIMNIRPNRRPDGTVEFVTEQVGTRVHSGTRDLPQVHSTAAQVGIVAKLVDAETGEIVWVGSAVKERANALQAADSAVAALVRNLKKGWNPQVARR